MLVSQGQTACMRYTLQSIKPGDSLKPIVVKFASLPAKERPANCVLAEDGSGHAVIDPATMQVTHLEFTVSNHTIFAGGKNAFGRGELPVKGMWVASIDYAGVVLEGKTFWMPTSIDSKITGGNASPSAQTMVVWTFNALYSNYHKLEVTSRILPGSEAPAP